MSNRRTNRSTGRDNSGRGNSNQNVNQQLSANNRDNTSQGGRRSPNNNRGSRSGAPQAGGGGTNRSSDLGSRRGERNAQQPVRRQNPRADDDGDEDGRSNYSQDSFSQRSNPTTSKSRSKGSKPSPKNKGGKAVKSNAPNREQKYAPPRLAGEWLQLFTADQDLRNINFSYDMSGNAAVSLTVRPNGELGEETKTSEALTLSFVEYNERLMKKKQHEAFIEKRDEVARRAVRYGFKRAEPKDILTYSEEQLNNLLKLCTDLERLVLTSGRTPLQNYFSYTKDDSEKTVIQAKARTEEAQKHFSSANDLFRKQADRKVPSAANTGGCESIKDQEGSTLHNIEEASPSITSKACSTGNAPSSADKSPIRSRHASGASIDDDEFYYRKACCSLLTADGAKRGYRSIDICTSKPVYGPLVFLDAETLFEWSSDYGCYQETDVLDFAERYGFPDDVIEEEIVKRKEAAKKRQKIRTEFSSTFFSSSLSTLGSCAAQATADQRPDIRSGKEETEAGKDDESKSSSQTKAGDDQAETADQSTRPSSKDN